MMPSEGGIYELFNASRITKAYGTAVRKGDDVPDRPHRLSRILDMPNSAGYRLSRIAGGDGRGRDQACRQDLRPRAIQALGRVRSTSKVL